MTKYSPVREANETPANLFRVDFWGGVPVATDTLWNGESFENKEAALALYNSKCEDTDVQFIVLDGPTIHEERKNPKFVNPNNENFLSSRRQQIAMQG